MSVIENSISHLSYGFHDESAQVALTKAQRAVLLPKFALALEEIVRHYLVWHNAKFGNGQAVYTGKEDIRGLSWALMGTILEIFNVRAPNDDEIIHSTLGSEWKELDSHGSGLGDRTIFGDLILACMLDTISVICFALANQKKSGDTTAQPTAVPLSSAEVEEACKSYKSAGDGGQAAKHAAIRALLSKHNSSSESDLKASLERELVDILNHHCPLTYEPSRGGSFDWYRKVWED